MGAQEWRALIDDGMKWEETLKSNFKEKEKTFRPCTHVFSERSVSVRYTAWTNDNGPVLVDFCPTNIANILKLKQPFIFNLILHGPPYPLFSNGGGSNR